MLRLGLPILGLALFQIGCVNGTAYQRALRLQCSSPTDEEILSGLRDPSWKLVCLASDACNRTPSPICLAQVRAMVSSGAADPRGQACGLLTLGYRCDPENRQTIARAGERNIGQVEPLSRALAMCPSADGMLAMVPALKNPPPSLDHLAESIGLTGNQEPSSKVDRPGWLRHLLTLSPPAEQTTAAIHMAEAEAEAARAADQAKLAADAKVEADRKATAAAEDDAARHAIASAGLDLRKGQYAEALTNLAKCSSRPDCNELRVRVLAEEERADERRAGGALRAADFVDAASSAQACLNAANPAGSPAGDPVVDHCRAILGQAKSQLVKNEPNRIKDVHIQSDAGGYEAYFSVVDGEGRYMAASGHAEFTIELSEMGARVRGPTKPFDAFDVRKADFRVAEVGLGNLARTILLVHRDYAHARIFEGFPYAIPEQWLAAFLNAPDSRADFVVRLTTPSGNVLSGREQFSP